MQSIFGEKSLTKLRGIVLAVILISGALSIALPSALPDAYAVGNKPSKVENLILVISSTQILLIWDEPSCNNECPIIGYHIEQQEPNNPIDPGFADVEVNTGNTLTTYLVTGLTPDTGYNFKVSAINAAGEGASSNQKFGTTLPGPAVTLSTSASDPTNQSPIPVTATFSEDVTGFTIDDITVTNGSADNFVTVSDAIYTFDVTPFSDGLITVDVPATVAFDIIGTPNTAASTLSITYDGTDPGLTLSTAVPDPANVSPFTVTATFSEDVTGFALGDISVTNGIASSFAGGPSVYTFSVTPSNGLVSIDVGADVAIDAAGNGNTADSLNRTYDGTAPGLVLSTDVTDPTNVSPITVTATFSEDVTDFQLGDIIVTNGIASSLAGGPSVYTFDVTPLSNGLVSIDVPADAALDAAGNGNTAAATLSRTSDAFLLSGTAASQTIINLEWTAAPENDSECSLERYDVYRDGEFIGSITDLGDRTFSDTGLLGDTEYTYQVKAIYCDEPSAVSNEVTITTKPFINSGLSWDITPPSVEGINFSSVQSGTPTEGFGGRLASYSNDIPTQVMNTGEEQRFQISVYDNNGIAAIKRVVVNMFFDYYETQKSDTYFMYIEGEGLTVSDPFGFFGDVKVHRTYTESEMILTFVFTPQKSMPITDIVINGEDE